MVRHFAVSSVVLALAACSQSVQPGSPEFTQDQNAHAFAVAANVGEIEEAQLALERGTNAGVKSLAQTIIDDHSRSLAAHMQLGNRFNTATTVSGATSGTPAPPADVLARVNRSALTSNAWAADLVRNHESAMTGLRARSGSDFDNAWIERQIAVHRHVLNSIDALLPTVTTPELRAQLQNDRTAIAMHLQTAEGLR